MEIFLDTDIDKFFEIKDRIQVKNPPYWTAEVYGFGKQIREYGRYPKRFPLCINTDHGASGTGDIYETEIKCDAPVQFYHLPLTVQNWRERFVKPCYVLYSPFVFYRRKNNIEQLSSAKGTIVFPGHTTPEIDDVSEMQNYIDNLEALPEKFKPLSICLHYHDVNKGVHKIFLNKGYRVFSAGHPFDYNFIKNFYNILRNYTYSTSNLWMSCLFYSVEMNIPHFIYGNAPELINKSDINLKPGTYDVMSIPRIKMITEMFQGPLDTISAEQMELVKNDLGITQAVSRNKMSFLLHKALFIYTAKNTMGWFRNTLSRTYRGLKKSPSFASYLLNHKLLQKNTEENLLVKNDYITSIEVFKLKSGNRNISKLLGKTIGITDSFWYLHSLKEIFGEEVYRFESENPAPYILDCGANIGLSIIYFKRLFPEARIIGFEPDTHIYSLLKNNLISFGFSDVVIENKAIWTEDTVLNFSAIGSLGGSVNEIEGSQAQVSQVPAVRLRNYLSTQVDFLKMDIEGAEVSVIKDCSDLLKNVMNLFVEYHSYAGKDQELDQLLLILREAGFVVYIKEAYNNLPVPFMHRNYSPWYNLQLNIFAYRSQ